MALGGLDDPLIAAMLDAMARRLAASDVALLLATGAVGELETATSVRELISRGARAVIFAGAARPMRAAEDTQANCLPWLSLDAPDSTQRIGGASGFDRARAHALALRYLYDLGHRRIALLGSGGARLRQATRAALGETSLVLSHIEARATAHGRVADGLAKLLAASAPPTALLCATDSLAAVALNECARQGISVPHALAIVGFGDSELGRHLRPSLTTVRVPAGDAGVAAAEHVVALLEGRMVLPVKLAVKLIVRESSGPVRTDGS
ncbi:MAG: substrate-binding domain-containing protein [Casimicrobiaceae bacterium]